MPELSLIHAFAKYQTQRGLSRKTIARRNVSLRQFARVIHPLTITEATPDLIEEWLGQHQSPATRRSYRADLNAFYTWARRRGVCDNPVDRTEAIRVPRTLPRPVPPSYLPSILAAAEPDVRIMIALAAYAGLRCAEIAALHHGDIDLLSDAPTIAVRSGKGCKDRIVPVHPDLAALLATVPPGPVVHVNAQTVGVKVAAHMRSLGINATCHKLRHSFGSELARAADGNIILVATLMGHESIDTSMRYIGWAGGPGATAVSQMYPKAA